MSHSFEPDTSVAWSLRACLFENDNDFDDNLFKDYEDEDEYNDGHSQAHVKRWALGTSRQDSRVNLSTRMFLSRDFLG